MRFRCLPSVLTPALLLLGLAWLATPTFAAPPEKVEICHIPPDDPDRVRTVRVAPAAAEQHFVEHGDFEVGVECSEGIGECEVFGEVVCVAGDDVCTASALFPPPEPTEVSCADGLDNDCDGEVDEACPDGQTCNETTGQCEEREGCPCLESWNNGVAAPPLEGLDLTGAICQEIRSLDLLDVQVPTLHLEYQLWGPNAILQTPNLCVDINFFGDPQEEDVPVPPVMSEDFAACKQALEELGCVVVDFDPAG